MNGLNLWNVFVWTKDRCRLYEFRLALALFTKRRVTPLRSAAVVSNVFERIREIVWKPQEHEFVVNYADGSARALRLQGLSNEVSAELVWSIGSTALETFDTVITTVGLSRINRRLLEQRGAIDESTSSSSLGDQESLGMLEQWGTEGWH